jgi:hypothetical protein
MPKAVEIIEEFVVITTSSEVRSAPDALTAPGKGVLTAMTLAGKASDRS